MIKSCKKVLFFAFVAIFLLGGAGCSTKKVDTNELLLRLCEEVSEGDRRELLYSLAVCDGFEKLEFTDTGWLYYGKWEEPNCASRIESLSVRLPIDDSGFEIHIIKGFNVSDAEELATMFEKRLEKMQNSEILQYAPENFERYFRSAEIFCYKGYVFLLATPDNVAAKKLIKRLI